LKEGADELLEALEKMGLIRIISRNVVSEPAGDFDGECFVSSGAAHPISLKSNSQ
jgi:hypothetical protein